MKVRGPRDVYDLAGSTEKCFLGSRAHVGCRSRRIRLAAVAGAAIGQVELREEEVAAKLVVAEA